MITIVAFAPDPELLFNDTLLYVFSVKSTFFVEVITKLTLSDPPFVFLSITRPRKVTLKYEDENGDLQEANLDGMISRIVQHEYDHILGKNFTDYASKMKLDRAFKKAEKEMDRARKLRAKTQSK